MKKLLIGGSPCTYWSVAQKKNREVEAEGLGWELFKMALSNYPDIIEMGDAFALRDDGWELGKRIQPEETTETATDDEKPVDKATDLSDAPEGAKRKIIENAEALEASEAQEEPKQQDKTKSSGPAVPFDATEQLRKLADERFTNDILAIEYAVKVLEAMAI